jgi:hypothetical protein
MRGFDIFVIWLSFSWFIGQDMEAILRQASAQAWHAVAHCWQWPISCFAHSSPQDLQILAHSAQIALACSLPRAIAAAANAQMAAQSMSSAMQRAIFFTSGSCKQAIEQELHAIAHALQASMQASNFLRFITILL